MNGVQRNSRVVLANVSADPVPSRERAAFTEAYARAKSLLSSQAMLASADKATVRQTGSQQ